MHTRESIVAALAEHHRWRTSDGAPEALGRLADDLGSITEADRAAITDWNQNGPKQLVLDGDLSGLDMSNLDLRLVIFKPGTMLCRVDLRGSDLRHTRMEGVCLEDARLSSADIDGSTNLRNCDIGHAGCADLTSSRAVLNAVGGDTVKAQQAGIARAVMAAKQVRVVPR